MRSKEDGVPSDRSFHRADHRCPGLTEAFQQSKIEGNELAFALVALPAIIIEQCPAGIAAEGREIFQSVRRDWIDKRSMQDDGVYPVLAGGLRQPIAGGNLAHHARRIAQLRHVEEIAFEEKSGLAE